jgi:hypothetical protein
MHVIRNISITPMESIIERYKDRQLLRAAPHSAGHPRREEQDREPWLLFFLKTTAKQKEILPRK